MYLQCRWKRDGIRCEVISQDDICPICKLSEITIIGCYHSAIENILKITKDKLFISNKQTLVTIIDKISKVLELRKNIFLIFYDSQVNTKYSLQLLFTGICKFLATLYEMWNNSDYKHDDRCCNTSQIDKLQDLLADISTDPTVKLTPSDKRDLEILSLGTYLRYDLIKKMDVNEQEFRYLYDYIRKLKLYVVDTFNHINRITNGSKHGIYVVTTCREAPYNSLTLAEIHEFINSFTSVDSLRQWCQIMSKFLMTADHYYIMSYISIINNKCTVIMANHLSDRNLQLKHRLAVKWLGDTYLYDMIE